MVGEHPHGWLLVVIGVAAGVATLLGGALALRLASRIHLVLGFSAGAVIGVALLDLLPEAMDLGRRGGGAFGVATTVAVGFLAYLVVDRALLMLARGDAQHRGHFGAGSLTTHSLLDGVAIGLGFQASAAVGLALTVAVLAHDLADGMNTVNLSLAGSKNPSTAGRWLLADAAAPLAGIGLSRLIVLPAGGLGLVVALFAGFFLYIGASETVAGEPSPPSACVDHGGDGIGRGDDLGGRAAVGAMTQLGGATHPTSALDAIIGDIRACRACASDLPHEPRPVVRVSAATRLLIRSQAPGRRVHESGLPFDDASGDRLRDWMGVDRATFYGHPAIGVAGMAFCYPGTAKKGGDLPPPPRCARLWGERLLAALPNVELTLLVGGYA